MSDNYSIDLEKFSLDRYHHILATEELLPSHRVLKDNLDEHFAALKAMGFENIKQVFNALSTKKKQAALAQESGIPLDYLAVLRRNIKGYIPNPVNFRDIPDLDPDHVERLAEAGIKHTKHMFEQVNTLAKRASLSEKTGIPQDAMLALTELTDLARLPYVGPIYLRLIYEAGTHTVQAVAEQQPEPFFDKLVAINQEHQYTRAKFTLKDIALTIDLAKQIPQGIEF